MVNITVFRVSVAFPCTPITPISIDTVLKVLELLPVENLSTILEYRFALQQQQKSKKMCHFMFSLGPNSTILHPMFSAEKIAYVTCMLDNNSIGYYTLCSTSNILFLTKTINTASFCISIWSNARGGNYIRFKKGLKPEYGNSGPENFVHPPFKISGSAPENIFIYLFNRKIKYFLIILLKFDLKKTKKKTNKHGTNRVKDIQM